MFMVDIAGAIVIKDVLVSVILHVSLRHGLLLRFWRAIMGFSALGEHRKLALSLVEDTDREQ